MKGESGLQAFSPVIAVVLLGTVLRFYGLGTENLWLDEALSWQQAILPVAELMRSVAADVHPPVYALMLHFITSVFGDSEWVMRALSAICGAASVWLTWLVCRRLATDRTAVIASLLCAVSLFNIQYAQEARMYTLMGCLALLSMLLLIEISAAGFTHSGSNQKTRPTGSLFFGYLLATCLLLYTHVYGLFIVLAQNLFMALRYLPPWPDKPTLPLRSWIKLQVLLGILFAPWVIVLISQINRVQTSFWLHKPYFNALRETFIAYMGAMPALQLAMLAALAGLITLLFPAASTRWLQRFKSSNNLAAERSADSASLSSYSILLLLALWLLTPILLPYLISQYGQSIYLPRYTIASSFAWFILVAIGIERLPVRWLRYGFLAILMVIMAGALPFYFSDSSRTDWPAAAAYLEQSAESNALVFFHSPETLAPYRYYRTRDDLVLKTAVAVDRTANTKSDKPDVRPVASEYEQVWLISGYDYKTPITEPELVGQLAETHELLGGQEFGAIRVFQFKRPPP